MKQVLIVFFLLLSGTINNFAQQITVQVDIESAQSIAGLLAVKKVSDKQLTATANLYGNRQLIQKVKGYSGADSLVFKATLKEIIETGTVKGNDPYNWKKAKAALPELQRLLQTIAQNKTTFTADVAKLIQPYTPDSLRLNVRACFLIGGGSLGFTLGNDHTFNVALQEIGDDVEGLKMLMAHELYHSVQSAGYKLRKRTTGDNKPTYNEKATYGLLYELWAEGSASFIGDDTTTKNQKPFTQKQAESYRKNNNRMRTAFYLLETVLYQAYNDPKVNYQQLYNIGFTTEFEEVFYAVGGEIARQLVAQYGPAVLAGLVVSDPLHFIQRYIQLYREKKDKQFIRFSAGTEELVEKMMLWADKI